MREEGAAECEREADRAERRQHPGRAPRAARGVEERGEQPQEHQQGRDEDQATLARVRSGRKREGRHQPQPRRARRHAEAGQQQGAQQQREPGEQQMQDGADAGRRERSVREEGAQHLAGERRREACEQGPPVQEAPFCLHGEGCGHVAEREQAIENEAGEQQARHVARARESEHDEAEAQDGQEGRRAVAAHAKLEWPEDDRAGEDQPGQPDRRHQQAECTRVATGRCRPGSGRHRLPADGGEHHEHGRKGEQVEAPCTDPPRAGFQRGDDQQTQGRGCRPHGVAPQPVLEGRQAQPRVRRRGDD